VEDVDGQVTGDDDGDGIEDGAVDILGRGDDHLVQLVTLAAADGEFAIDVLDHDHGAVDQDAEVDGADGKQVGGDGWEGEEGEGEEQGEGNGERGDDGGTGAGEEEDEHDHHQDHAAEQVVLDGVDGELYQVAAIVVGTDLDVARQLAVEFGGFLLDTLEHGLGL